MKNKTKIPKMTAKEAEKELLENKSLDNDQKFELVSQIIYSRKKGTRRGKKAEELLAKLSDISLSLKWFLIENIVFYPVKAKFDDNNFKFVLLPNIARVKKALDLLKIHKELGLDKDKKKWLVLEIMYNTPEDKKPVIALDLLKIHKELGLDTVEINDIKAQEWLAIKIMGNQVRPEAKEIAKQLLKQHKELKLDDSTKMFLITRIIGNSVGRQGAEIAKQLLKQHEELELDNHTQEYLSDSFTHFIKQKQDQSLDRQI
jgi:hypothetical protein